MRKYEIIWTVRDWCGSQTGGSEEFRYTQEVIAVIDPECEIAGGETFGGDIGKTIEVSDRVYHDGFALYQNRPNPYNGETVIGFKLPKGGKASLTIYSVTGKLIKRVEGKYDRGYNKVRLSAMELGTTGVLYYQLDTDRYTATKKMIVVD